MREDRSAREGRSDTAMQRRGGRTSQTEGAGSGNEFSRSEIGLMGEGWAGRCRALVVKGVPKLAKEFGFY